MQPFIGGILVAQLRFVDDIERRKNERRRGLIGFFVKYRLVIVGHIEQARHTLVFTQQQVAEVLGQAFEYHIAFKTFVQRLIEQQ